VGVGGVGGMGGKGGGGNLVVEVIILEYKLCF
jgi:hypothetical protein